MRHAALRCRGRRARQKAEHGVVAVAVGQRSRLLARPTPRPPASPGRRLLSPTPSSRTQRTTSPCSRQAATSIGAAARASVRAICRIVKRSSGTTCRAAPPCFGGIAPARRRAVRPQPAVRRRRTPSARRARRRCQASSVVSGSVATTATRSLGGVSAAKSTLRSSSASVARRGTGAGAAASAAASSSAPTAPGRCSAAC